MIGLSKRLSKVVARFPGLMPLLGGMLMALGPAPLNLWIVAWVAIVPLWWVAIEGRSPVKSGILWGIAYHGISLFWITGLHPLTWMGISYVNSVAIVAVIWMFITLFGAVCVGLWAGALAWMTKRRIHPIIRVLSAAALWCAIEQVRSYSALDWTGIAYTQSPGNLAILHLGQISGNALIAAAIVAVNGAIAESWRSDERSGFPRLTTRVINRLTALRPAIVLFTVAHLIGWGISLSTAPSQSNSIRIGTVQGNIGTRTQFSEAGVRQGFKNYSGGYETLVGRGAQMVLFPEGSFPMRWADYPDNPMAQKIQALKVPVALGASGLRADRRMTQAMFMLDEGGKIMSQYDKVKVVPLGEALPFEEVLGKFIRRIFPIQDSLVPGQPDQIFKTPFGQAGIGICYESAFPEIFRRQVQQGATFLMTASNLDPYSTVLMAQQEAHDTMRAIETDRPMIRVTNTGYSGLIESTGQIKWRSQPNRYDLHISELYPRTSQTLYVRYGNWITPLLLILSVVLNLIPIGLTRQR
ncbi:MAG: apolipoprotein N-acyltransferase [Alkalinema sp. CAN_BIN05]|nr:apolipoprotein N-acyltransferase [Alkalinema sp. CAN_BIN05]